MPKKATTDAAKTSRPVKARRQREYLGAKSVDFAQAVLNPAPPNAALRNAFKRYRQQVKASF